MNHPIPGVKEMVMAQDIKVIDATLRELLILSLVLKEEPNKK